MYNMLLVNGRSFFDIFCLSQMTVSDRMLFKTLVSLLTVMVFIYDVTSQKGCMDWPDAGGNCTFNAENGQCDPNAKDYWWTFQHCYASCGFCGKLWKSVKVEDELYLPGGFAYFGYNLGKNPPISGPAQAVWNMNGNISLDTDEYTVEGLSEACPGDVCLNWAEQGDAYCDYWAEEGHCVLNPWMIKWCKRSCKACTPQGPHQRPTKGGDLDDLAEDSLVGKVVVMLRGTCYFAQKAVEIQRKGAIGGIVINTRGRPPTNAFSSSNPLDINRPEWPFQMMPEEDGAFKIVTIPIVFLYYSQGMELLEALARNSSSKLELTCLECENDPTCSCSVKGLCECVPGSVISDDGSQCIDIDECATSNHTCAVDGPQCHNRIGSYVCGVKCGTEKIEPYHPRYLHSCDKCALDVNNLYAPADVSRCEGHCSWQNGQCIGDVDNNVTASSDIGTLVSPGWPDQHPDYSYRVWLIRADYGQALQLVFDDFQLETHSFCVDNKLTISTDTKDYDNDLFTMIMCGKIKPFALILNIREIVVVFNSYQAKNSTGFRLLYSTSTHSAEPRPTQKTDIITNNPPSSEHGNWTFEGFAHGAPCTFPFLEHGQSYNNCITYQRGRPWCGVSPNLDTVPDDWGYCPVKCRGRHVQRCENCTIDDDGVDHGPSWCEGPCSWMEGACVNLCPARCADCRDDGLCARCILGYRLTADGTMCADIDDCAADEHNCKERHLCETRIVLGEKHYDCVVNCGNGRTAASCMHCPLERSSLNDQGQDMCAGQCSWQHGNCVGDVDPVCGSEFLEAGQEPLMLESPGWPDKYPSFVYCNWVITAPTDQYIMLKFKEFDIEAHQKCLSDTLFISSSLEDENLHNFLLCGNKPPSTLISSNNQLVLTFSSDRFASGTGFLIEYSAVTFYPGAVLPEIRAVHWADSNTIMIAAVGATAAATLIVLLIIVFICFATKKGKQKDEDTFSIISHSSTSTIVKSSSAVVFKNGKATSGDGPEVEFTNPLAMNGDTCQDTYQESIDTSSHILSHINNINDNNININTVEHSEVLRCKDVPEIAFTNALAVENETTS